MKPKEKLFVELVLTGDKDVGEKGTTPRWHYHRGQCQKLGCRSFVIRMVSPAIEVVDVVQPFIRV